MKSNTKKRKKRIISFAVMLIFIAITLYIIFQNYELSSILSILKETDFRYIILAFLAMLLYVALEAGSIGTITRSLGVKHHSLKNAAYASVDLYFSAITPSSEGGQPMMIYTMSRDGISVSKSTISAVLFTNMFTGGLLICTVLAAIFSPNIFFTDNIYFRICLITGIVISLAIFVGCILLLRFGHLAKRLGLWITKVLVKLHIVKHPEKAEEKLDRTIEDFSACSHYIRTHPLLTLQVLILAFLQRVVFFSVPYFIYLSFGLHTASYFEVFTIQVLTQMSVYALPIPGSAGATEAMLLLLYQRIYSEEQAVSAMLLARGVTFYFTVCLCGLITLANSIVHHVRRKEDVLS